MKENEPFALPESIIHKLYDLTGTSSSGTKGFILAYVNSDGIPSILNKFDNMCVNMALKKTIELFIEDNEDNISL
jgi:hypothetical protein